MKINGDFHPKKIFEEVFVSKEVFSYNDEIYIPLNQAYFCIIDDNYYSKLNAVNLKTHEAVHFDSETPVETLRAVVTIKEDWRASDDDD